MPRFFVDDIAPGSTVLTLVGEDAHHIGFSLRMRVGEAVTVCAAGMDYDCEITAIAQDRVELAVLHCCPCEAEPTVAVTLYQALPKLDKLEQILQKSVELGVARVVPVLTRRCVNRQTVDAFSKKLPRLQKIAHAAAMQSGRGIEPQIAPLLSYRTAIAEMAQADTALVLYEAGGMPLRELAVAKQPGAQISLLVGSEGGFDPGEIQLAKAAGIQPIWLGNRILRCETAPVAALSVLMYLTNNL